MSLHRRHWMQWAAGAAAGAALPAAAQFRVEVTGIGQAQLPFAVAGFRDEALAGVGLSAIVFADLVRSGVFKGVDAAGQVIDENTRPDLAAWKAKGVDNLVTGSVTRTASGFDVRYRLWDVVRGTDLGGQSIPTRAGDLRLAAHRIADAVYEKLTGEKGVFSTRLAYVTKSGSRYNLWVADSDGEGAVSALASPEPIISPAWSPSGAQLAYVSFESRKPVIYVHELATGRRRLLANYRGSNSAPCWSPDGQTVVATLSKDGGSQLYAMDARGGGEPRRLTQSGAIDTEPEFSPDGRHLYFVSDRGGAPQIYRMPAMGGGAERVTFQGGYNISPAISPDGKSLAYVSRVGGAFKLHVQDLASGAVTAVSETTADESPSFAPNSRLIVYATVVQGREALMTTTLDGKIKAKLGSQGGDIREPDWGPFVP